MVPNTLEFFGLKLFNFPMCLVSLDDYMHSCGHVASIPLMYREDVASSCGMNHWVGTRVAGELVCQLDVELEK